MKNLSSFFKRLRALIGLVATLVFFLTVLLPPVLGLITRQVIVSQIATLHRTMLAEVNLQDVQVESVRAGWFTSDIRILAHGPVLSADGQSSATRAGLLHIYHGPVIWHLSDSLLALTDIQLLPAADAPDLTQHFAGSAIVKLTTSLEIQLDLIAGISASGGEHWLELKKQTPLLPFLGDDSHQLWLDVDVAALTAAGMGEQVQGWQRQDDARLSNHRLLFNIGPQ